MVRPKNSNLSTFKCGKISRNVRKATTPIIGTTKTRRSERINPDTTQMIVTEEHEDVETVGIIQNNYYAPLNSLPDANPERPKGNPSRGRVRIPPIVVKVDNFYNLCQKLNAETFKVTYKHMSIGTGIITTNVEEHRKVIEILKNDNISFFTHDIKSEKPLKVVLRGLHSIPEKDLKDELSKKQIPPLAIFPMKRKSGIQGRDQPYLIHFNKAEVTLNTLKKNVKNIFYTIVNWELYVNAKNGPTLCNNCLQDGHGTKNCNMPSKCNICGKSHRTNECTVTDPAIRKCANCSGNHPASSIQCPKRQQYLEIRNKIHQKQAYQSTRRSNPIVNINDSNIFPALTNPNNISQNNTNTQNNQFKQLNLNTNNSNLFGANELLLIFNEMIERMQNCKDKKDQIMVLGEICIKYVYGHE